MMSNMQKILTGMGTIALGLIIPSLLNGDATVSLVLISLGLINISEIKIPRKHKKAQKGA